MCPQYENKLHENEFLRHHYECLPFIGEQYEKSRLLLIGESHYVPKEEIQFVDRRDFYEASFDDLAEGKYKRWINTREVFNSRVYDKKDFKGFFSNPATEIARVIYQTDRLTTEQKIEAMHYYSFMNYFKRPSFDAGKTITELTNKDYQLAYDVSKYIIEVLAPKLIIFISKKAYYAFCDSDQNRRLREKYVIEFVSHPSCCWWNKKRKDGGSAREDFYNYVATLEL